MPRNAPGKAALKARIGKELARLGRIVPVEEWDDDGPDLQLASWPRWIEKLLADLVLLQPLDPLAALRGLGALDRIVTALDNDFPDPDNLLPRQRGILALFPAFQKGLGGGNPRHLPGLVVTLVTEDDLLGGCDPIPDSLLQALGRDGRVAVTLRLAELRRAGSCPTADLAWRMTEILLAEPTLPEALALVARLGLEEQVAAWPVVQRFLESGATGPGFMDWVRRMLREPAGDLEDSLSMVTQCVQLCDGLGQPELAQAIRREALPLVLDVEMLCEWLDRLPELQKELEEARALREVAGLEDKAAALLFLLEWPDPEAAARLVMVHHEAMVGQDCGTFNDAAKRLEPTAPRAAMLLYRRGAFCVFSNESCLLDWKPRIDRCAALWARYPDGAYDSHAEFMDRLERERRARW